VAALDSVPRPPTTDDDRPRGAARKRQLWLVPVDAFALALYSVGWLVGSVLIPIGFCCRWMFAAIAVGWDDAGMSWRNSERINP
jgi:hypothetical protein